METEHIDIGKYHVACTDHQWDQVVAEPPQKQCGKQVDDHDHAVHGDQLDVHRWIDE